MLVQRMMDHLNDPNAKLVDHPGGRKKLAGAAKFRATCLGFMAMLRTQNESFTKKCVHRRVVVAVHRREACVTAVCGSRWCLLQVRGVRNHVSADVSQHEEEGECRPPHV